MTHIVVTGKNTHETEQIQLGKITLRGNIDVPESATGIVIFAHPNGSSRLSPRNQLAARLIRGAGLGTLLFDLLSPEEEEADQKSRHLRFDIPLLATRLMEAASWVAEHELTAGLKQGFYGINTGGAAALVAAMQMPHRIGAVVSRAGRPDLAGEALPKVQSPTLLIVGERDPSVLNINKQAFEKLKCEKDFVVVPGAGHLFQETGALEKVSSLAGDWFKNWL